MADEQQHDADADNPDSNNMAKDRTDWAEDRTSLANERTFAGWMRTGMASIGVALGLRALFGEFEPTWLPKSVATLFVGLAIFIFWSAQRTAAQTNQRMADHLTRTQPRWRMRMLAALFSAGGVVLGAVLWWL